MEHLTRNKKFIQILSIILSLALFSQQVSVMAFSGSMKSDGNLTSNLEEKEFRDVRSDIESQPMHHLATMCSTMSTQPFGLEDYAVFATHSICLKQDAQILSGSVGVNEAGEPPFLSSATELTLHQSTVTPSGYDLKAHRITIKNKSVVHSDVYTNELDNNGTINGTVHTSLILPLFGTLPPFHEATPGTGSLTLNKNEEIVLSPGAYGDVVTKQECTIVFTGGIYNLLSLRTGDHTRLVFREPTEVRIKEKCETGQETSIGPEDTTALGPLDIVFYVGGINGNTGEMGASPKSASIGQNNTVRASFYVPNGTLWLGQDTRAEGTFIGQDVLVDHDVVIRLGEPSIPDNQAPVVNAGPDQTVAFGVPVLLAGTVTDDGLPMYGRITAHWSQVSGPYPAVFDDTTQAETTVRFNAPGTYILRLTASDGALSGTDDVRITVNEPAGNAIPVVDAGPDQTIGMTYATTLEGTARDDGLPYDKFLSVTWSRISGPGHVGFRNVNSDTTDVTFSQSGTYVLRLTANDGEYSVYDDAVITVHTDNLPPEVDAGEDRTITSAELFLQGRVQDDGLPAGGMLTFFWTKTSGPGTVSFQSPDHVFTNVSFGQEGRYVLRLTVDDSQFRGFDELTVTVVGNRPPVVEAGEDRTLEMAVPVNIDDLSIPEQPEAQPDWLYDIGRSGVNGVVGRHGLWVKNNEVYVGGFFDQAGGAESGCVAKWNGCGWSTFFDPRPVDPNDPNSPERGYVYNLHSWDTHVAVQNENLYLFGTWFNDMTIPPNGKIDWGEYWDGFVWNEWCPYIQTSQNLTLYASSDAVYVGGNFIAQPIDSVWSGSFTGWIPGYPTCYSIIKWNWSEWEAMGEGIIDIEENFSDHYSSSVVRAIIEDGNGNVFVGGNFDMETPSGMAHNIIKWDGNEWQPVGIGISNEGAPYAMINDIQIDSQGNLIVGGWFNRAGSLILHNVAKASWDPVSQTWLWSDLSGGLNDEVFAIALKDTSVYIGGEFTKAGVTYKRVNYLARWDGNDWHAIESSNGIKGMNNHVHSLSANEDIVYIGGSFSQAGGEPASYIVGWGVNQKKHVEGPDSVLITDAPQAGAEATVTALVSQRCGSELTLTWNVDGGPPEGIQILEAGGTTADTLDVRFTHFYVPGTHLVTLTVEDGECVPIVRNTTVTVIAPVVADLSGSATDDGLPEGSALTVSWSLVSGPAPVHFDDPNAPATRATFDSVGTYVLRLTGDDTEYTRYDEVTVHVRPAASENRPPSVNAGLDRTIYLSEPLDLYGSATDDGLPTGTLTFLWSKASGPGTVTFDNLHALQTDAHFSAGGTYVLRLTADDSEFSTFDELAVYVSSVENQPPEVFAGDDQTIPLSGRAVFNATIQDDGLLYGILNTEWTQVSGLARVYFGRLNGIYYARLTEPGDYALSLSATDGSYTVSDTIHVTVTDELLPPTAEISLPCDGDVVAAPLDIIGTVNYINLGFYTLQYRKQGDTAWIPLSTGTESVLDGVLGTFDPTLLMNGLYVLRLEATDLAGQVYTHEIGVTVRDGCKVGNFTVSFIDLDIPVSGIPIQVVRTYDSRDKKTGDFGTGWTLDIRDVRVQETGTLGYDWAGVVRGSFIPVYCIEPIRPHIVTVTASDGTVHQFEMTLSPNKQVVPPSIVIVGFIPRYGTTSSLTALGNINMFVNGSFPGMIELVDFQNSRIFDPDQYVLTLHDGRKLQIDQIEGLELLTDRNANTLRITDDGILHSSGKSVTFTRDTQGRITQITDPMNNTIHYVYDTNGDLISVTDQEDYTTTFTYGTNHYLTSITDPRGITPARQEYDENGRMTAMIDAEGDTIHTIHNLDARQEIVRDRLGNVTVYEYDEMGNVTAKTDAEGNVWLYTYDDRGNKLSETDPDNNTRTWTYDANDNLLTETDPLGNTTTYTYNAIGKILTKTDLDGNVTSYTYDESGNLISETDPAGNTIIRAYDGQGSLLSESDNLGAIISETYDSNGNVTKETDPFGHETTFTYDNNGNQLTQTTTRTTSSGIETLTWTRTVDGKGNITSETDPDGNVSYTEYNAIGKKSAEIDKLGRRTEYVYDDRGNETEKIYPDGTTETTTFDANGNRTSTKDRSGRTTYYEYDPDVDRISKVTFPTSGYIHTDTDATGSYTAITDDKGNTTRYEYDADGNMIKTTDALGDSTTYTYDAVGNQLSMTDARGNRTYYEYDAAGRKVKTIFPDGTFIQVSYDVRGNKLSETDQAGNTIQFEYDPLNRLVKVIDALNNETTYTYDEVGNKLTQTDANGHTTNWEYDNLGRVIKRTLPLGQHETFTYDANGNMLTHTDFNGNTITFEYDENNRLVRKSFPNGTEETYAYTETGRSETVTDTRGLTQHVYDSGDRLTRVTHPDGSSIEYEYDSMGNRTAVIIGSERTEYTFDQLNRLETVTDPDGGVTTYTYDANGNRESVTYPNHTKAEYTYDFMNRLTKLFNHKSNGDTISCYEYALGPAGNRTQVVEHTGRTVNYVYDNTYKLTEETIDDPDFGLRTISYTYDDVGNRLTKTDNGVTTTYTYDNNDRLLTENTELETRNYSFDNNGNTLTKVSTTENITYSYDYQNRLIWVNDGVSVIEYAYDSDGIRVQKTVDNVDVVNYLVDKNRDYAQVLRETDGNGNEIVSYTYGDDLISQKRSSLTSYYHYDGQHSTRQLTNASANITDGYTYDAFGVLINMFGATKNDYLYTGEQFDPNAGFYYLRARYYNQSVSRFLTMDTWPGSMFEPLSLHKYLYCHGSPIDNWDPSGHAVTLLEVTLGIAIATILLCDIVQATLLIKKSWQEEIEWNGQVVSFTLGSLAGIGIHHAYFISESVDGEVGRGLYLIIVFGITIGVPYVYAGSSWFDATLVTPGIFGPKPWTLMGLVTWLSATAAYGGFGGGSNITIMGFGKTKRGKEFGSAKGAWDIGIDIMGGFSFKLKSF